MILRIKVLRNIVLIFLEMLVMVLECLAQEAAQEDVKLDLNVELIIIMQ